MLRTATATNRKTNEFGTLTRGENLKLLVSSMPRSEFNVKTGAVYFNTVLKERGGFLQALGAYNGWVDGMTWEKATAFATSDCVRQNNLDYLQSVCNGLLLGVSSTIDCKATQLIFRASVRRSTDSVSERSRIWSNVVIRAWYDCC